MLTVLDSDGPLSDQEMLEVQQYAKERISLWRRRSIRSIVAFLLSCLGTYTSLQGHPPHEYWGAFGKYLVFVSMAMLVVFVFCRGFFYSACRALRKVEKGQR